MKLWEVKSPLLIQCIGVASILFFGFGVFVGIKRLIKSEIALIIDPIGLNVNPKKSLTEFIKWDDHGFKEIKIHKNRIVIIGVKKPDYWLKNETKQIKKKLMKFNITKYNSTFETKSILSEI